MTRSSPAERTILYVSGFSDIVGGGQISFFLLLEKLDRSRFKPLVLCPAPGEVSGKISGLGIRTLFLERPALRTWRIWRIFLYCLKLRSLIRASGAGVIHCDTLDTALLCGLAFSGVPLILHARVSDGGGILDSVVPFFCDRMICVSKAVSGRFPRHAEKVRVVLNGVDTGIFRPVSALDSGRSVVGYCGQLVEGKGVKVLLEAFKIVKASAPGAVLAFAGRGPAERELKTMTEAYGIRDSVVFHGFVKDIPAFLSGLDIFVLPTLFKEGLSRSLIEAMACAKPAVATPLGGNAETIVDGETGLFCRPGDSADLAAKLLLLLTDRKKAAGFGEAARRRAVELFSIDRTAAGVQAVYDELLPGTEEASQ